MTDPHTAATTTTEAVPALGVLFVHGIGSQTRGQTLTECASALLDCLKPLAVTGGSQLTVERTRVALEPPAYEPAHAVIRISGPDGQPDRVVVLAESWWAADFPVPRFTDLASWMLTFGSWVVISHVLEFFRRWADTRLPAWLRRYEVVPAAVQAASLATVALALFALQLVLLLLSTLAVIPIGGIRRWVASIVLRLEGLIGDSYAFSANPIVNAAVSSRVLRDVAWLEHQQQCRAVAVVAHSQGAAIAVRALERYVDERSRSGQPGRVRTLITYGSGLVKLTQLEWMNRPPRRYPGILRYLWLVIASIAVTLPYFVKATTLALFALLAPVQESGVSLDAVWTLVRRAQTFVDDQPLAWVLVLGWMALGVVLVAEFARHGRARFAAARDEVVEVVRRLTWHLDWVDLYATHDPVPNGPVRDDVTGLGGFSTRPVVNGRSFVRDHVTYWPNTDEFVAAVVKELNEVTPLVALPDAPWFAEAAADRSRRISGLLWVRRLVVAAALAAVVGQAAWVTELGRTRVAPLLAMVIPGWLVDQARKLMTSGVGVFDALAAFGFFVAGATVPAAVAWIWYRLPCREVWDYWDRTEVHIRLRGDPPDPRVRRLAMIPLAVFVLIALAGGVRAAWWGFPQLAGDAAALWAVAEAEYRNRITLFGFFTVQRVVAVALAIAVPIAAVALLYRRWRARATREPAAPAPPPPRTPGM